MDVNGWMQAGSGCEGSLVGFLVGLFLVVPVLLPELLWGRLPWDGLNAETCNPSSREGQAGWIHHPNKCPCVPCMQLRVHGGTGGIHRSGGGWLQGPPSLNPSNNCAKPAAVHAPAECSSASFLCRLSLISFGCSLTWLYTTLLRSLEIKLIFRCRPFS